MINEKLTLLGIVDCIGEVSTSLLITAFAGQALYIPLLNSKKRSKARSVLHQIIGEEAVNKLIAKYAGKRVYIPNGYSEIRQERNRLIANDYDNGATQKELAIKYELSSRRINSILNQKVVSNSK